MKDKKGLIVFFIPGEKLVNGGILSIFSICKVSRQFEKIHKSRVLLSTYPGQKSYKHNDLFENNETIYSFDEVVKMGVPKSLMLHVPEYASHDVYQGLKEYTDYIKRVPKFSVNIMNQNIWLMQKPREVANWFGLTNNVTQTTAHNKYTSQELADKYFLPTRHFSTFVDPSQYHWTPFNKKENIIALSPDVVKERDSIVNKLKNNLPDYKIITIHDMKYEGFKKLVARAKFTITFGEGFDGYYVEAFFSGSITFAVYNDAFFPDKDFANFENTYPSYTDMLENIDKDIKRLNSKTLYEKTVQDSFDKIAKLYSFSNYKNNIKEFYLNKFTFYPNWPSAKPLIADIIREHDQAITEKDAVINERQALLEEKEAAIRAISKAVEQRDKIIHDMVNSRSWKLTKPLRKASSATRKKRKQG